MAEVEDFTFLAAMLGEAAVWRPDKPTPTGDEVLADPRYASHAHRHQAYLRRGRYIDQIERLVAALGSDRVLVLDADDFFLDPQPAWERVCAFVGLSAFQPRFEKHNARPRTPMPVALREKLDVAFEDSDERLARWWARTPSWRRSD